MSIAMQIPESFQQVFGLGSPQQIFEVRKLNRWGSLISALLLLAAFGFCFLYGLYYTYERYVRYGPAVIWKSLSVFLIVGGVCLVLGLWATWSAFSNWNKAAVLYTQGLAYYDRKGLRSWRWEDISSITAAITRHYTNGVYAGTTHIYTLTKQDGEKLVMNDAIQKVEELTGHIQQNVFPRLYQQHAEVYNSGRPVVYGPVSISKAGGLQIGKKSYAWDEIQQVKIQQGVLSIAKKGGGWFSGATAGAASIPNLEVLLAIIDQVVGLQAS